MSGIFRTVEISWGGKTYEITPSMHLLRSIEASGVSLFEIAQHLAQGRPQISHISTALSRMLQSKGVDVSDEDVYAYFMGGADPDGISQMVQAVVLAFAPQSGDEKKVAAQPNPPRAITPRGRRK